MATYERKDALYQRAKREGYRSRAAYKLLELQRRTKLLRRDDVVVDLGAWPGGWVQVAAELVGPGGRVVGVDLQPITPLPEAQVILMRGDVADRSLALRVRTALGRPADVVLADLAPKLSGIAPRDAARAAELTAQAIGFAATTLRPGGTLVLKTFGGAEAEAARATLREQYERVRLIGLEATRRGSSELYLIATERQG